MVDRNVNSAAVAKLDPNGKAPIAIKAVYKTYQKLASRDLVQRPDLIAVDKDANHPDARLTRCALMQSLCLPTVFEIKSLPGLSIYPSLLSQEAQLQILDSLFHRDLSNPEHKTNVHLHYGVPYPQSQQDDTAYSSYFHRSAKGLVFEPQDSSMHKPFSVQQFLDKKLRWMTLGGQYDWTNKVYPSEQPPDFPSDVKKMVEDHFPMKAEAAIVNLYSPGDTLALHRDVSEECDQPLVSISLGCDGIFVVGLDDVEGETKVEVIRLKSGDAVLMSGESRYAWHGVPKVVQGTCPTWMEDWPCIDGEGEYAEWKGWMKGKRINLNVRQMYEPTAYS